MKKKISHGPHHPGEPEKPKCTEEDARAFECISGHVGPSELARMLRISRPTLWRYEKKGAIPPRIEIYPGRRVWLIVDVINWQKSRR